MDDAINTAIDGAVVIGFVNAANILVPNLTSKAKIALALIAAVVLTFVPFGPQFSKIIDLLFGSSGIYKSLSIVSTIRR